MKLQRRLHPNSSTFCTARRLIFKMNRQLLRSVHSRALILVPWPAICQTVKPCLDAASFFRGAGPPSVKCFCNDDLVPPPFFGGKAIAREVSLSMTKIQFSRSYEPLQRKGLAATKNPAHIVRPRCGRHRTAPRSCLKGSLGSKESWWPVRPSCVPSATL